MKDSNFVALHNCICETYSYKATCGLCMVNRRRKSCTDQKKQGNKNTQIWVSMHKLWVYVSCQPFYRFKAQQQVSCSGERGPLGAYGSGDDVTVMSQLIAALDDERQGVMVVGGQLVAVQDHHLGTSHLLLIHTHTQRTVWNYYHLGCCFLMQEHNYDLQKTDRKLI